LVKTELTFCARFWCTFVDPAQYSKLYHLICFPPPLENEFRKKERNYPKLDSTWRSRCSANVHHRRNYQV